MDHVWLEGGNLHNSTDCKYFGPIPCRLIRGCVFFKIWPLSDLDFYLKADPQSHSDRAGRMVEKDEGHSL
uniref:Peptidase S26 domain-containing protein n=1 Tax=Monodon monoceros TaxID=40151 RepID=A0A8C6FDN5_MONMO